MLGQIWSACDTAKAGKLNKPQLVKMFGCIGQVQAGMPPNPAAYTTAPAPKIDGLPIPGSGAHAAASSPAPSAAATSSIAGYSTRPISQWSTDDVVSWATDNKLKFNMELLKEDDVDEPP